jgi:hypothetical protein
VLTASEAWDEAVLTLLAATAAYWDTLLQVGLFTNVITPTRTNAISDFTEPTFTGYARVTLTMSAPIRGPGDILQSVSQLVSFGMTGTPVPTLVQGYFMTFGAGPAYYGAERFQNPIQMNDQFDILKLVLNYNETNLQQGGVTIVI